MLVNAVDRIAFERAAVANVVVPPPLPVLPLQLADSGGAIFGGGKGGEIAAGKVEARQRLNGINLVGKAADVSTQGSAGRLRQSVGEQTVGPLPRLELVGSEQDKLVGHAEMTGREGGGQSPCADHRRDRRLRLKHGQ